MRTVRALIMMLLLAPATPASSQSVDTMAIRGHTRFLADDLLAGRGTGTEGERLAAAYIVSQAKRIGLEHVPGAGSFLLPVPLREAVIDPASRAVVSVGTDSVVFRTGEGFIPNTGAANAFTGFGGRLIFYGDPVDALPRITAEASLDGRVAVFVGPLGGAAIEIIPALRTAGAAGVVLLVPDDDQFDLFLRSRGPSRYFVDAPVDDPVWQPELPVLLAGPRMTTAIVAGWPQGLEQAERGIDLGRSLTAHIQVQVRGLPAANVAAVLPGSDPLLRNEYVAYTAHYDHLGISTPDETGDSIYNGFSDNAAGVAMLLAIAETLRADPPARSVLFLFFTGEERGLLGSSYFAASGAVALDRIAALINLDAGAPPAPPVSWRIAGGDSPLGEIAQRIAASHDWTATLSTASPNSDHWPFVHRGVPSIFIIPGGEWENVDAVQRDALRERWNRYHHPADHWHADFPFAGLGRYADYALRVGLAAAGAR
jgi:hypothetical protein